MSYEVFQNDIPKGFKISGHLAIDTETRGLVVTRDRLCVLQFSSGNGDAFLVKFDGEDYNAPHLKKLLLEQKRIKIFHYARFDLAVIKHYLGIELENVYCTKIASKLCRTYTDKHGLKDICKELLNIEISKQMQTSDWAAEKLSKEQIDYAASDVLYLHQLKKLLDERLKRDDRTKIAQACFNFLPTRSALDLVGWEDSDIFQH